MIAVVAGVATAGAFLVYRFTQPVARDRLLALRRLDVDRVDSLAASIVVGACVVGYEFGVVAAMLVGLACAGCTFVQHSVRSHRELDSAHSAVIEFVAAFAGELRAGRPLSRAIDVAAEDAGPLRDVLQPAALAAQTGGDVAGELRLAADATGLPALRAVAACCSVSAQSGTALASTFDRVAGGLRADQRLRDEARAQLAGPRTTAYVLAALPVFGLLLADGVGAHPLTVLLRTPIGGACLAVGCALDVVGLLWMGRLVRSAEP